MFSSLSPAIHSHFQCKISVKESWQWYICDKKKLLNVDIIFLYLYPNSWNTFASLSFSFSSYFSHFVNWINWVFFWYITIQINALYQVILIKDPVDVHRNFYDNFKYSFSFYLFLFLARFDRNVSFRIFQRSRVENCSRVVRKVVPIATKSHRNDLELTDSLLFIELLYCFFFEEDSNW